PHNTALVFDRQGVCLARYDKTHLFSPMGEHEFFQPGNSLCTFRLDGVLCGLLICYDIRFPELARSLALQGMEVLFLPAQWPKQRVPHLSLLCEARAVENQMFVACCNSCGSDASGTHFGGHSCAIDPWGKVLARAGGDPCFLSADCDLSIVAGIRGSINVFQDRRPEVYRLD
ncbi:MAG: carbon-nitrogen family hydrolase, partial [Clostridia bacterium]|nr:carbon-nitrogen family hydrolase [Clostridia bacterium]